MEEAVGHIAAHSTGHSEAILTRDEAHAALFTAAVDSAAVYVNCSTRFTDGGEFGLGCEMGISTQKLHARGPMGLEELCSYKVHHSRQRPDPLNRSIAKTFFRFFSYRPQWKDSGLYFVLQGWTVFVIETLSVQNFENYFSVCAMMYFSFLHSVQK